MIRSVNTGSNSFLLIVWSNHPRDVATRQEKTHTLNGCLHHKCSFRASNKLIHAQEEIQVSRQQNTRCRTLLQIGRLFKGLVHQTMKIAEKCTHNHPRCRGVFFFIWKDLEKSSITCSPLNPLQWMGAVRMRVQTAKHHNNPHHSSPTINVFWSQKHHGLPDSLDLDINSLLFQTLFVFAIQRFSKSFFFRIVLFIYEIYYEAC